MLYETLIMFLLAFVLIGCVVNLTSCRSGKAKAANMGIDMADVIEE